MNYGIGNTKIKLLMLKQILEENTNEEHVLTIEEIISLLAKNNITVERKTLYNDIDALIQFGVDIVKTKKHHANAYFIASSLFSDEELMILVDAVSSSRFLTIKKTKKLLSKLQTLTNKYSAKKLKMNVFISNRVKTDNEKVFYNIDTVHTAIEKKRQLKFRYLEYTSNLKRRFKHDGLTYLLSPYYLVWESDNYYVVGFCSIHNKICRYRIDRLSNIVITDEKIIPLPQKEHNDIKNMKSLYCMFGEEHTHITVKFDNSLIGVVADRYGTDFPIIEQTDDTFTAILDVQLSPPFYAWFLSFGAKVKIIEPLYVIDEIKSMLKDISNLYLE